MSKTNPHPTDLWVSYQRTEVLPCPYIEKEQLCNFGTHTPTQKELNTCPHINLSSRHPWNPSKVDFVKNQHLLQEEIQIIWHVSTFTTDITCSTAESRGDKSGLIFSLSDIIRKITAMGMTHETEKFDTSPPQETLQRPNEGSGHLNIKEMPTFQNTGRHTDTSPEDLSQRWLSSYFSSPWYW